MVFTVRFLLGFILLLIACIPLQSASTWRQTRQTELSALSESQNGAYAANYSSNLQTVEDVVQATKTDNETRKGEEKPKRTKTEDTEIHLNRKTTTVSDGNIAEGIYSTEASQFDEFQKTPEKNIIKKQTDEKKKEKPEKTLVANAREENSRAIDVDIDRFTSSEFHNKNNVFTMPISLDIHKYISPYAEQKTSTLKPYDYARYADFHAELTTPKNELFDLKHRQIVEGVEQNLEEMGSFLDHAKLKVEKDVSLEDLLAKANQNDTSVHLDYKAFTSLNKSEAEAGASVQKESTLEKGSKLYFNETYNDTKITDDQNIIPISGPDSQADYKAKDSKTEEKLEVDEGENVKAQKSIEPTTRKSVINFLTKPPVLNKTGSLISNKIEVEPAKPIEINKLKLVTDPPHRTYEEVASTTKEDGPKREELKTTTENINRTLRNEGNISENQIYRSIPTKEATTQESITTHMLTLNKETTSDVSTTETTPHLKIIDDLIVESTTIASTITTEASTMIDAATTEQNEDHITETTVLYTAETTASNTDILDSTISTNDITNESTTAEKTTTESVFSSMMNDGVTQTDSPTQDTTTYTETSIIMEPTSTEVTTQTNIIVKTEERIGKENASNNLLNKEGVESNELQKNSTIMSNTTADESTNDVHKESPKSESEEDEEENNDYGDAFANRTNKTVPSNPEESNNKEQDLENGERENITMVPEAVAKTESSTVKEHDLSIAPVLATIATSSEEEVTTNDNLEMTKDDTNDGTIIAIIISCVGAVCLIVLVTLLIIMRKRQKRFNYGQRCTPVSLDDYSMDNVSVYNSVRRKGVLRVSKRSYGNPAFEDPSSVSHLMSFPALARFANAVDEIGAEFEDIPQVTTRTNELPDGCETKNRYANVIPLPETRVFLNSMDGYPNSDYINANYVTGPKGVRNYYIACQAPMQNTVEDFWRMIWEQQSKVVLMLTHNFENGAEKCFDYLPPSEVSDCQRLFGDLQVTLKKREVKTKYIISTIQLKNMVSNSWREIIHLWYIGWPEKGVPEEANSIITFLIEARSYLKIALNVGNSTFTEDARNGSNSNRPSISSSPLVVHCSPGTGRTGSVIACDVAIREFELTRQVDIPKIVYKIRRDRASSVQTRDQYAFVYKVISLYATKLTGGGLDSI